EPTLAIRFERGLDARFFLRRQRRRFVLDRLDDVPAHGEVPDLGRNVLAVPGEDSCAARHATILQPFSAVPPTAGARAGKGGACAPVLLPRQALRPQRPSGAQTQVPFLRQGMATQAASAPNLRLPMPTLSPVFQRGV